MRTKVYLSFLIKREGALHANVTHYADHSEITYILPLGRTRTCKLANECHLVEMDSQGKDKE